jgi:hypothetical protein
VKFKAILIFLALTPLLKLATPAYAVQDRDITIQLYAAENTTAINTGILEILNNNTQTLYVTVKFIDGENLNYVKDLALTANGTTFIERINYAWSRTENLATLEPNRKLVFDAIITTENVPTGTSIILNMQILTTFSAIIISEPGATALIGAASFLLIFVKMLALRKRL